jgi:hypothetical protein
MAGSITTTNIFQNQVGPLALSQLDADIAQPVTALNTLLTFQNYYPDTSVGANTVLVTVIAPQIFAYTAGTAVDVKIANTNTGASVLNVNSLGNKSITHFDGSALIAGELIVGAVVHLFYDGTQFQLQGGSPSVVLPTGIPTVGWYLAAANTLGVATAGLQRGTINATGNWTINVPSVGNSLTVTGGNVGIVALQVNAGASNLPADFNSTAAAGPLVTVSKSGTPVAYIGSALPLSSGALLDAAVSSAASQNLVLAAGAVPGLAVMAGGIAAPTTVNSLDLVGRGVAICRFKAVNEDEVSDITVTNDADLKVTIPYVGTYSIELFLFVGGVAGAGAGGLKIGMNYSGVETAIASGIIIEGTINAAAITRVVTQIGTSVGAVDTTFATVATFANPGDFLHIYGVLTCPSNAGILSLEWAQNSSNVTGTRIGAGSWMTVTQLS